MYYNESLTQTKSTISFTSQGIRIGSTKLQTKEVLTYLVVTSQPNDDQSAQAQGLIKKAEKKANNYHQYTYRNTTVIYIHNA